MSIYLVEIRALPKSITGRKYNVAAIRGAITRVAPWRDAVSRTRSRYMHPRKSALSESAENIPV